MNPDGSRVRLDGIHKWFGSELHVLRGIELAIAPGEVVVVIGPSGSGKSTLLRTITSSRSGPRDACSSTVSS